MRWMELLANGFDRKYEEGMNQGLNKGIKEGIKEGILSTAKKMLKRNMEINEIQEITGLSKEEIEKLAKSES